MKANTFKDALNLKEVFFQLILHVTVFVFFSFDRKIEGIDYLQLYFFLNYVVAALFINYFLLPRFFYKNKYLEFAISVTVLLGLVIFLEEVVLEQIFYPDTRGKKFSKMFYNLLSTAPTITILVGFKFAWDALIKQREVSQLKEYVKESELQFLKSQINPHFLFNNMNNLYSYAVEGSPKTPELILEFSAVLRYMLYDCRAEFVPLIKEMDQLENYVNLSKLQIEGRGNAILTITGVKPGFQIAPLILNVFIENAFKHSVSSMTNDIEIEINVAVDASGVLSFCCKNSFLETSNTESLDKGIGLDNVRKRLELMYPNTYNLEIMVENFKYEVYLKMELNKVIEK
ncbi:MAG: histidine kinase [Flavicella sp.]|nr:histidine kinase [Flavicella sp.]